MAEVAMGLSPQALGEAFPFHFVLDDQLRLVQAGPGLARLEPRIRETGDFDRVFLVVRPRDPLTPGLIGRNLNTPVVIEHRPSGIRLRGQFLQGAGQTWVFVGSPWFETAEALEASGLSLSDFAAHDPITDLLMLGRTRQMAAEDLKVLAESLERQRAELARTESRYRRAISAARAVPYRENFATDSFDFIGEGVADITGIPTEEITPARLASMVVESSEAPAPDTTARVKPGDDQHRRRDLCIRTSDGRLRWISDSSVLVLDDSGHPRGQVGILMDITGRKNREELLRASEARASQLAEVVSRTKNAVLVTDADRRIVWANPAFEAIVGEGIHGIQGRMVRDLLEVRETVTAERDLVLRLDAGEPTITEVLVRNRQGREWNFIVEWQPIHDTSGQLTRWMMVANDVTEARKAQELLRAREEESRRLAMVAARTDNAVILTDTNRRIQWVNEGFTRMTGYTLEEVKGQVPGQFLQCPETDPRTVEEIGKSLGQRQGFKCEIQNRRRDGRLYWVSIEVQPIFDPSGDHTGYMAIESDCTARRQYEDRLRQLSTELETVLKLSPDGYATFDGAGRLSYFNSTFEQMVGVGAAELRGLGYAQVDRLLAAACDAASPPTAIVSLRPGTADRLVLKGTAKVVLSRSVIPIAGQGGEVQGRILFLHDVTREEELQQMKSDFLSTAAHELRTPMTSVQGFSELLLDGSLDPDTIRDVAATIHRQSSTLVTMVNELLDLQRIEQRRGRDFDRAPQPLQPIVSRAVSELRVANDPRKVVMDGLPGQPVEVSVDAGQLGQALTNVLNNAYKYSPGGGEIHLSLESRVQHGVQQVGIRVQDQGIGMTPSQRARVFERFYRADPSGTIPGTGLGMALVKEILELHDGQVDIDSAPGAGTTVTLWLPVCAGKPEPDRASQRP
jgi:PAS domain S-box-containing protein